MKAKRIFRDLAEIYVKKRISRSAASLSYFLTLSIFPFLIVLNALLGLIDIPEDKLIAFGQGIIPASTLEFLSSYLTNISQNNSGKVLVAGLLLMFTSSSAVFRTFMGIMADMQGKARFYGLWGMLVSFVFSVIFLFTIYASCLVIMLGEWFMSVVDNFVAVAWFISIWRWARFAILFLMLYTIIYAMYAFTAPKTGLAVARKGGALIAAALLVIISMVFSYFIGMSVKYTLVYGSLASIIILMVWLYLCGHVLVLGNAYNIISFKYSAAKK
ncbi:MAG: YihY/virulence factor BrkB family protein [Oscillospiraceae bacterium]